MRPFPFANCKKYAISKLFFCIFFWEHSPIPPNGKGLRRTSQIPPLRPRCSDASRLPRLNHDLRSFHLPYLEIKLTFECTAWFYALAPPLLGSGRYMAVISLQSSVFMNDRYDPQWSRPSWSIADCLLPQAVKECLATSSEIIYKSGVCVFI